jgi:hypothetical protein
MKDSFEQYELLDEGATGFEEEDTSGDIEIE